MLYLISWYLDPVTVKFFLVSLGGGGGFSPTAMAARANNEKPTTYSIKIDLISNKNKR